jgi:IS5 family transposase
MLLVGYCFGIRSERRLCEEVHLNLAYRWFCRLGLDGKVPDHSTFSKNRHGRFRDSDAFRHVFETVVSRCIEEGLVGGEGFAVDASLIPADANKQRSVSSAEQTDWHELAASRRAVREYLDTLDQAAWGGASEVTPKFISRSDPAAQWTGALKGHAFFAYADNYLIDLKAAVIVDVEATRAIRQAEVGALRTMIERISDRFGLKPKRLAADSAYGSAPSLHWLVETQDIAPHIPVFDKSRRDDGTFSRSDFQFDGARNVYNCPGGQTLTTRGTIVNDDQVLYRASKLDCAACALKARCFPKEPARKVPRNIFERARDPARVQARLAPLNLSIPRQDNATHGSTSRIGYGSADRAELKCSPDSPGDPRHVAYGKASGDASDVVQQARSFGPWRTITQQFHRLLFARRCRQPAAQAVFSRVYS